MKQETTRANHIELSESARKELVRLDVNREIFLRIGVIPGGCSGLTYQMDTDTVQTPFDTLLYEDESLKVVTDKNSFAYLKGVFVDYSDDLMEAGFRFTNPNAAESCGCGESFSQ